MLPFTVMTPDGTPVGMTTFMNIDAPNRRLEIGSTWISPTVQRTPLNTECKTMLLTYAFEVKECIAVELRTHVMNHQSRRAIERLGAKLDGILRSHMIMADGSLRDTAVYSILAHEWPAVRSNLQARLEATP
jgi:RimJ/RimL family protein N-acetyltransferase